MATHIHPDHHLLVCGDEEVIAPHLALDTEPLETEERRVEVRYRSIFDQDLATGDGGETDEGTELEMDTIDTVFAPRNVLDTLDLQDPSAYTRDPGTEPVQPLA